ncbi:hypothetical protein ABKV19_006298 [Rosa sericea]
MSQPWNFSSSGSTKTQMVGRGAWGILSGSDAHHTSSDATLFSSSLPVLPHPKLNLNDVENGRQSIDDLSSGLKKLHQNLEGNDPIDDIETHAIGSLLPGDEEELLAGVADDLDLSGLPGSLEDLEEYDLFGSGGGMELESDPQDSLRIGISKVSLSDGSMGNGMLNSALSNGVGTVAGEHPYGEHPSRTLFVRNINSNVEDSELRALFEDNPSEKDVNQGTLVVFNLDPSVSNEDLLQIFGAYGEVKEIRETPHKRHHKFIEYYDVRAAEAALKSLNRSDIAGKRIKLEPSRPGGARRNLMLQLNQDPEQDESRNYLHPVGSPVTNSPPGSWVQFNSPTEHSPMYSISKSPGFRTMSPTNSNYLPGLASILHPQVSNTLKVAPIGSPGRGGTNHIFTNTNSAHGSAFQQSHSVPEPQLSHFHGTLHSSGPSTSSGSSAVETLSGPQFLWGSPTVEKTNSSVWPQKAVGHQLASNGKGHTHPFSGPHSSFLSSSPHHHHVGSAPSGIPFDRHFSYVPESAETSFLSPVAYGGMGLGPSGGNFRINRGTHTATNIGFSIPGSVPESSSSSFKMMSSPKLSPVFLGNGPYMGLPPTSIDGLTERGRSRRVENNGNQIDSKKQFQLDLDKIVSGEDTRTTLMIKNIPNKYTSKMLLAAIDENHRGTYDFLYLPIDFKNKCNVGYAFINMLSPSHIIPFYEAFNGKKWEKFNSEKVASLAYGRIQGKAALVTHFQNSSLMNEDKRCRPILFISESSEAGDQVSQPKESDIGASGSPESGGFDENKS